MTKQIHAPLYERLTARLANDPVSFHVPGHKYGRALPSYPYELFRRVMQLDVTELADTDDLHHPEGVIREAERLAADCFGAEETFFLVGGSTAGNLALLLAICQQDDIVIVQRNVHKSVMNGLLLTGARPVFISPMVDTVTGTLTVPSLADIEQAMHMYPEAKAVMLSTPNYYGVQKDLEPYANAIHAYRIPLLVDEAHGAHYGLHGELPRSALSAGADAVVQSTHKTLTALTMGAMLHVRGGLIDRGTLREALSMIQSSSPSYPIMASLDIARAMAASHGAALFEPSMREADRLRGFLQTMQDEPIAAAPMHVDGKNGMRSDPLRILLYDRTGKWTGIQLAHELAERNCWAEMADERYAVLLLGIGTTSEDVERLLAAIRAMNGQIRGIQNGPDLVPSLATQPPQARTISEPFRLRRSARGSNGAEAVSLQQAIGRESAESVIPYPPGIPILYPGERISAETVARIEQLARAGARFQAAENSDMSTLLVMKP